MQNKDIEIFLDLVQARNITKTAEHLFLAQSVVSTRLKRLEEELGYELFTRSKGVREMELTRQGREFVGIATRWKNLFEEADLLRERAQVLLRIAAPESVYYDFLEPIVVSTIHRNQALKLSVQISDSSGIYDMMENNSIDFGFASYESSRANIIHQHVYDQTFCVVSYTKLAEGENLSPLVLDPGKEEAEVVYESDFRLGHAQICPTDENLIFYIHETEGDAFQRTWMCDVKEHYVRPFYVEHPSEWITHEVWAADGAEMALMKLDPAGFVDGSKGEVHTGNIIIADKDGRHFDIEATSTQLLHPCISRDRKWLCADRISYLGVAVQEGVVLVERATGKQKLIATTGSCKTGADHQHPSFNRRGDMILFSNPDENGIAQVCTIDLKQVMEDWQKD